MTQHVMSFGDRLRKERGRLGLSQAQLGAAGGVSQGSQAGYESGQRVPDLEYLDRIAECGVDKLYICTGLYTSEFLAKNFDWQLHKDIIAVLQEFASENSVVIPPAKQADLIRLLYEDFVKSGAVEPEVVVRALRLVA